MALTYRTLTLNELIALGVPDLVTLPIDPPPPPNSFLEDLTQRRGRLFAGGNPSRFVELVDGVEVPMIWYEPDAKTSRLPYYYNTRINKLFKRIKSVNPISKKSGFFWQLVSEC